MINPFDKKQKKKAIATATQIFSNKKRTSTKTNGGVVFCDWNGCAYVDVDAKKFFEKRLSKLVDSRFSLSWITISTIF